MTSKKAPSGRRAVPPRPSDRTKAFTKDWTRLSHSGRYDMRRLKEVMLLVCVHGVGPENESSELGPRPISSTVRLSAQDDFPELDCKEVDISSSPRCRVSTPNRPSAIPATAIETAPMRAMLAMVGGAT